MRYISGVKEVRWYSRVYSHPDNQTVLSYHLQLHEPGFRLPWKAVHHCMSHGKALMTLHEIGVIGSHLDWSSK